MKIRENVYLKELEYFRYKYEENLIFPTYKKVIKQGNTNIVIEILIKNRTIFINRNKNIRRNYLKYLEDLYQHGFIQIEEQDHINHQYWLKR